MDAAKKFFHKIQIKNLQRYVDRQYKEQGLTDEVLNKQLEINKLRNKHNISDKSKRLHEKYVQ